MSTLSYTENCLAIHRTTLLLERKPLLIKIEGKEVRIAITINVKIHGRMNEVVQDFVIKVSSTRMVAYITVGD